MKVKWCGEHDSVIDEDGRLCHAKSAFHRYDDSTCKPVPMRLIPDNEEVSAMLSQVRGEEVEYQPGYFVWQMEADIRDAFVVALIGETP